MHVSSTASSRSVRRTSCTQQCSCILRRRVELVPSGASTTSLPLAIRHLQFERLDDLLGRVTLKCQVSRAVRLLQPRKCINRAQPLVRHVHKCHVGVDSRILLLNMLPEAIRAPPARLRVDLPPLRAFRLLGKHILCAFLRALLASSHKSDSSSSSHPLLLFVLRVCGEAWRNFM